MASGFFNFSEKVQFHVAMDDGWNLKLMFTATLTILTGLLFK